MVNIGIDFFLERWVKFKRKAALIFEVFCIGSAN